MWSCCKSLYIIGVGVIVDMSNWFIGVYEPTNTTGGHQPDRTKKWCGYRGLEQPTVESRYMLCLEGTIIGDLKEWNNGQMQVGATAGNLQQLGWKIYLKMVWCLWEQKVDVMFSICLANDGVNPKLDIPSSNSTGLWKINYTLIIELNGPCSIANCYSILSKQTVNHLFCRGCSQLLTSI